MKSRDFAFWLQGFFELAGCDAITAEQAKCIKTHLELVFKHDPEIGAQKCLHPFPVQNPPVRTFTSNPVYIDAQNDTSSTLIC